MFGKGVAEAVAAKAGSSTAGASGRGGDDAWIAIQKKTFTNWVNTQLAEVGGKVDSLEEDLKTGVNLIQCLEVCSKKTLGRYTKTPKIPTHSLENLTLALKFLEAEKLKLVNIGPQDIYAGNLKLILGLIWTIIYHFQVSKSFKDASSVTAKKGTAKDLLLEWVRATIPEYKISNFNKDWNDGRAICALTNAVGGEPQLLPNHNQMAPGAGPRNCKVGIDTAAENLGIPKLISPEDMADPSVDDLSMVTYISYFREAKRLESAPKLNPSEDNATDRAAMTCNHPGCKNRRKDTVSPYCIEHACLNKGCKDKAAPGTHSCPVHKCKHQSGCGEACQENAEGCPQHNCAANDCEACTSLTNSRFCPLHGCVHVDGCDEPVEDSTKCKYCATHQCHLATGACKQPVLTGDQYCETHTKRRPSAPVQKLPPPWERSGDWRKYEGPDLGGRCKIRVFYSSTTSSQDIRRNTKAMMDLLEREDVHKRPDFEPWIPIDVDMPVEKRNLIFEKAKTRITPMLFIDDEYIGDWKKVMELNETGELSKLLEY